MSSDEEGQDYFEYEDAGFDDEPTSDGDSVSDPDIYDVLSPSIEEAPAKKPYDVSYKVKSVAEIIELQQKEVKKVKDLLESSSAAILLRHYGWNAEKLQEHFWTDPTSALSEAGLSPPTSPTARTAPLPSPSGPSSPLRHRLRNSLLSPTKRTKPVSTPSTSGPFECPICCEEFAQTEIPQRTMALGCGHRFCKMCWTEYLGGKVKDEGESAKIQCMESGCKKIVKEDTVDSFMSADVSKRYRKLLNEAYVADSPSLRWCPHPECENVIECTQAPARMLSQLVPTVTCNCGRELCFGCGYNANHRPVLCKIVKKWQKKCADDSETANWLQANTKECTKCNSTIEKNGGCNHMTCKKCKHEFCWVCMGPWSEHGTSWYQCNRFDEKGGIDARDTQAKSRASLERYLHYFNRWANHEHSAKLDADFYKQTEKRMEAMQNSGNLSWIEVQFAKQAVDTCIRARITLKWSYCMAFYLQRNNMTELFEDNQRDLERAVENLGFLLQQDPKADTIAELRNNITNESAYVQKRHDILLDDTLRGYLENRWLFSIEV